MLAEEGYTANVPLADLLRPNVLFAFEHDGAPLAAEHGGPLRLVVPHLYAWKSVKWARGFILLDHDQLASGSGMGITRMGIRGKSRGIRGVRDQRTEIKGFAWESRMRTQTQSNRREFLQSAAAIVLTGIPGARSMAQASGAEGAFCAKQEERRKELWSLLGDLPTQHVPGPAKLVKTEKRDGYTLERQVLDLNGIEPVPAILLIPDKREARAPGLLYIHWHGGMYDLGKEQLWKGVPAQPAYAPVCAEKGIVTLAMDSWCFGERKHEANGHTGEEDAFKLMLWKGQVLFGMMMFDVFRAFDYLAHRPEVDPQRLGVLGMSMGSTKAWWLAALEPRVKVCVDVCCLTDYEELIKAKGLSGHGIYYYVPSLLKHFQTAEINELIVPRPHLSVNGRLDPLTPPRGVEKIRDYLMPLYGRYGKESDCRVELYDCAHVELPEMRKLILEWMDQYLAVGRA